MKVGRGEWRVEAITNKELNKVSVFLKFDQVKKRPEWEKAKLNDKKTGAVSYNKKLN